jgi:hypothetical protein
MTMRIARNPYSFFDDFVYVADHWFSQLKLVRWVCGGIWFKSGGTWSQCDIVMVCSDHTYVLRWNDLSFHETNLSVQDLEDYT